MTRKELIETLKGLGFKRKVNDYDNTLESYYQIQCLCQANKVPLKAITKVYVEKDILRFVAYGEDLDSNYRVSYETLERKKRYVIYNKRNKEYLAMCVFGKPCWTKDMKLINDQHIFDDMASVYECVQREIGDDYNNTRYLMIQQVWEYVE